LHANTQSQVNNPTEYEIYFGLLVLLKITSCKHEGTSCINSKSHVVRKTQVNLVQLVHSDNAVGNSVHCIQNVCAYSKTFNETLGIQGRG